VFTERFDVKKVIDEACSTIAPLANKKGIAVAAKLSPTMEIVDLDQQKLRQVLYNLLSNAVKFTKEGGRVEILADAIPDVQLRVQVRDTGVGIGQEDMSRLFTEFAQLGSMEKRHEGTGLGLALTKKLVEMQHGTIAVESAVGKGSVFTVTLPLTGSK
jgi:signal transduction histidine kinase